MFRRLRRRVGSWLLRPAWWNKKRRADVLRFTRDGSLVHLVIKVPAGSDAWTLHLAGPGGSSQSTIKPTVSEGDTHAFDVDLAELARACTQLPVTLGVWLTVASTGGRPQGRRLRVYVPAGLSDQTGRQAVEIDDKFTAWHYRTGAGTLVFKFNEIKAPWVNGFIERYSPRPGGLTLRVRVTANYALLDSMAYSLTLQEALTEFAIEHKVVSTRFDPAWRKDTRRIQIDIDLSRLVAAGLPLDEDGINSLLQVTLAGIDEPVRLRLRLDTGVKERTLRPVVYRAGKLTHLVIPHLTFKGRRLSFTRENFASPDYRLLKRLMLVRWLLRPVRPFLGIWLVGERPYKAQDTGLHFFRWVRQHHPGRRCYFVIAPDSPERRNVDPLGNVVQIRSRQHIWLTALATRFVGSHHAEYLMASRIPRAQKMARGIRVFLQHGVMGMKNMVATYGRQAPEFHTDRFLVSSLFEQEMIVNDFGFRRDQVFVTGLSRFDQLLDTHAGTPEPNGLLIIPTWRDWIADETAFLESDFFAQWSAFLEHPTLRRCIAAGLKTTVIMHPNMRQFTGYFMELNNLASEIEILQQGDVNVQDLLKSHAALATDYSSVGFDFSFLRKPVFYFQFDRQRFIGSRPSHLDPVSDLPGVVTTELETVAGLIEASFREDFTQSSETRRRSDKYLTHHDLGSCQRIFDVVMRRATLATYRHRMVDANAMQRRLAKWRESRRYIPMMRLVMGIARLLPRNGAVVFESGNGQQYCDSPKAIYEQLSQRPHVPPTVWSTTSTFRPTDLTTRKVAPKTPSYYWQLGRASAWVSNQNFPLEVRPASKTYYLQTWHGTPLKRMQHDAVSSLGRKPGYLDRVAKMTGYWSALISPSPWASQRFRSAFRYNGKILEIGYPRNDALAQPNLIDIELTRQRLALPAGTRVVLYAPTFRDDFKVNGQFAWQDPLDWGEFMDAIPDDIVILVRRHQIQRGRMNIPDEYRHRILNVSSYPDPQDLLAVADALVTDYSSIFFDYSILERPIIYYCYDLEKYREQLRGFYLQFPEEMPGPVVETGTELASALGRLTEIQSEYRDAIHTFRRQFCPLDDGHAAVRATDQLLEHLNLLP